MEILMTPPHLAPFTEACGLVFLSGQLAFDIEGKISQATISGQTEQALANIGSVLKTAGLSLSDVVKTTVWLTQATDFPAFNETYAAVFGETRPARSTVISGLAHPLALVEIEIVARRPV
jgi:2-iminobutanoate/2-iminopropanoate deaminase